MRIFLCWKGYYKIIYGMEFRYIRIRWGKKKKQTNVALQRLLSSYFIVVWLCAVYLSKIFAGHSVGRKAKITGSVNYIKSKSQDHLQIGFRTEPSLRLSTFPDSKNHKNKPVRNHTMKLNSCSFPLLLSNLNF